MSVDAAELTRLERLQSDLQQRQREIVEAQFVRRADAIDRVRDAVRRLGELGTPTGILARAASEIGSASQFERVLISEVQAQTLVPLRIWAADDGPSAQVALATLRDAPPVRLEYPLVEHEALSAGEPRLVEVRSAGARAPALLTSTLDWHAYLVAPILVEGVVIGMLHADARTSGRRLDALDLEIASIACIGLGEVFDRAVLRETLLRHRAELQSAVGWISGRLRTLGAEEPRTVPADGLHDQTVEALTPREHEILTLMARGQTNAGIAAALVIREGTVKYHVKNVLRKLNARSRADAVAKYMRATGTLPG